jgi:hypothetical protein
MGMKGLEIKAYEIFKQKLGEAEANTIIEFIEEKAAEKINSKKDIFLTKEDKTDMIKWMFIFWVGQLGAMVGLILLFIKK